jgi:hypothetical protein
MNEREIGRRKFLIKAGAVVGLTATWILSEQLGYIIESESESPGNDLNSLYQKLFSTSPTETFKSWRNENTVHINSGFENAGRKYSIHEVWQLEKNQIKETTSYLTISYEGSESTYQVEKDRILKLEPNKRQRLSASEIEKVASQMRTDYQEWYANWPRPKPWEAPQ